jgi:hypothetical protein
MDLRDSTERNETHGNRMAYPQDRKGRLLRAEGWTHGDRRTNEDTCKEDGPMGQNMKMGHFWEQEGGPVGQKLKRGHFLVLEVLT